METVAIITARGGSKSIPKKNIVDLGGKPLIAYAIEAIKRCKSVSRIVVSTDSEEIAAVSREYGAETPFVRPAELAEDRTASIPVIAHALEWLEEHENFKPEYVLLAEPTAPFIKTEQIDQSFELMISKNADSAITVVTVPRVFHPYHVRHITSEGYIEFDNEEMHYAHPNRQSDPKRFAHGNLWWFKRDLFLKERKIEVGRRVGLEVDPESAHDINDPFDLDIARILITKHE